MIFVAPKADQVEVSEALFGAIVSMFEHQLFDSFLWKPVLLLAVEWATIVPTLWPLVWDVADALLAWMGPGGDLAFLDFYLLANGGLPPIQISHGRWDMFRDPIAGWSALSAGIAWGFRRSSPVPLTGDYEEMRRNRPFKEALLQQTLRERADCLWQAVPMPPVLLPCVEHGKRVQIWYETIWAPKPSFRTDLMGELAMPWPHPTEIPRDFLCPRRVVRRS